MDKRSWPWKKKTSDKQTAEKANDSDIGANQVDEGKQDNNNEKPKYVKISIESYRHLTGLEDQVKFYEEQVQTLEDEVKELNEKSSEANSEMTDKDNLVKQHAKVAEEAVSGWEKAEAEAAMFKNQVESLTLLKLTAEDRASHLDGALKECMRQIRNLKEEHDHKLHKLVLNKTSLFDKMKLELESQLSNLQQDLMKSAAENAALSRSLQDRSKMLIKLSEENSQAEAEMEFMKSNIESCEKEVNSLKYELHIARKEVEIRNEEKNMSVRSLEVANKQHLEGVKKTAKLDAECQRLRSLVRKKLPGPGALAQMKLEVENFGRAYVEPHLRRSPRPPMPEFSLDNSLKYQKENELITERLLAMDEQMRILKEALANSNSELQASRSIYAQTAGKLQSSEAQVQANFERKNHPVTSKFPITEDGNDDNVSCAGSWAIVSISENSYIQKEKTTDSPQKPENTIYLDLMDDFLEMEKLAHVSHGSNGAVSSSDVSGNTVQTNGQALEIAISCIYDFVMILSKEAKAVPGTSDGDGIIEKLDMFSAKYTEAINDSASDPDIPGDGNLVPTSESTADSRKCSLEEFEQLKMDKDNLTVDLARCTENFEIAKSRLLETEQLLADVKSQLTSAQKSNSLAETQLKCMAESYRALERRAEELQTEVNLLQGKLGNLDNELQEERRGHQDAVTRCNDLLEQLQRIDNCGAADNDKTSQEKGLTAAAEKLAECQETIYLLDKHLKALRPQTNFHSSPNNVRSQKVEVSLEEEISGVNYIDPSETDITNSFNLHRTGSESTLDHLLNGPHSPSESEPNKPITSPVGSKLPKHRPTKSGSSSASSTPTPEKQSRGFSRFFSSKGKNAYLLA